MSLNHDVSTPCHWNPSKRESAHRPGAPHPHSFAHGPSPPDVVARLEWLDDLMFAAIDGNATALQAAAWVPDDDPERPWDEAAELAADWIWQRSEIEDQAPRLVTNSFQNARGIGVLEDIVRTGGQTTPQGKDRFSRGPVLAYVPTERTLELALNLARGYSRAVVETDSEGSVDLTKLWKSDSLGMFDIALDYDRDGLFSWTLDGISTFEVIIPAPGACPVLAFALLGARRRRGPGGREE